MFGKRVNGLVKGVCHRNAKAEKTARIYVSNLAEGYIRTKPNKATQAMSGADDSLLTMGNNQIKIEMHNILATIVDDRYRTFACNQCERHLRTLLDSGAHIASDDTYAKTKATLHIEVDPAAWDEGVSLTIEVQMVANYNGSERKVAWRHNGEYNFQIDSYLDTMDQSDMRNVFPDKHVAYKLTFTWPPYPQVANPVAMTLETKHRLDAASGADVELSAAFNDMCSHWWRPNPS